MCKTGECIDAKHKCDGHPQCSDASDEAVCQKKDKVSHEKSFAVVSTYLGSQSCDEEHEFHCGRLDGCIPLEWVCDYVKDCGTGRVSIFANL